jgi:hypothetical protein
MKQVYFVCIATLLIGAHGWGYQRAESTPNNTDVKSKIDQLRSRLRWSDENSQHEYKTNRAQVTNEIWTLIDSFIAQTYSGSVNPEQLKAALDSMLGHKAGGLENTVVLPVDIPAGKFVIAGLEVTRGGRAIAEDAVSFRAYREMDGRWTLVSHVELEPEYDFLADLHALALPQGFPGTFGLIAWAMEPPLAPYKVITRVYAFDGQKFTTVWAPRSFITGDVDSFVRLSPGLRQPVKRLVAVR